MCASVYAVEQAQALAPPGQHTTEHTLALLYQHGMPCTLTQAHPTQSTAPPSVANNSRVAQTAKYLRAHIGSSTYLTRLLGKLTPHHAAAHPQGSHSGIRLHATRQTAKLHTRMCTALRRQNTPMQSLHPRPSAEYCTCKHKLKAAAGCHVPAACKRQQYTLVRSASNANSQCTSDQKPCCLRGLQLPGCSPTACLPGMLTGAHKHNSKNWPSGRLTARTRHRGASACAFAAQTHTDLVCAQSSCINKGLRHPQKSAMPVTPRGAGRCAASAAYASSV